MEDEFMEDKSYQWLLTRVAPCSGQAVAFTVCGLLECIWLAIVAKGCWDHFFQSRRVYLEQACACLYR